MTFTYLLVFFYTKNGNSYFSNMTANMSQPFSEDDKEMFEETAKALYHQKSYLVNIVPIKQSPKFIKSMKDLKDLKNKAPQ